MKKNICFLLLLMSSSLLFCQTDSIRIPRLLVGLETNIHFQDIDFHQSDFRYAGYGIHVEKPFDKISINVAIIKQSFSRHYFYTSTGEVQAEMENQAERFGYDYKIQNLSFLTIPFRLQYRFPCNCFYLQAGVLTSFRQLKQKGSEKEVFLIEAPQDKSFSLSTIKPFSLGYELAFGMNMHISTHFKLYGRLSYLQYGFLNDTTLQFNRLGNTFAAFTLGIQYVIY